MVLGGLVRLVPAPGNEEELLARVVDVAVDIRNEPGNILTYVFRERGNPRDVLILELFADQAAVDAHHAAEHSTVKGDPIHALLASPMEILPLEAAEPFAPAV